MQGCADYEPLGEEQRGQSPWGHSAKMSTRVQTWGVWRSAFSGPVLQGHSSFLDLYTWMYWLDQQRNIETNKQQDACADKDVDRSRHVPCWPSSLRFDSTWPCSSPPFSFIGQQHLNHVYNTRYIQHVEPSPYDKGVARLSAALACHNPAAVTSRTGAALHQISPPWLYHRHAIPRCGFSCFLDQVLFVHHMERAGRTENGSWWTWRAQLPSQGTGGLLWLPGDCPYRWPRCVASTSIICCDGVYSRQDCGSTLERGNWWCDQRWHIQTSSAGFVRVASHPGAPELASRSCQRRDHMQRALLWQRGLTTLQKCNWIRTTL